MSHLSKIFNGLYVLSNKIFNYIAVLFTAVLFFTSFLFTSYSTDMETQKVLYRFDNIIFNILGIAIFLSLFAIANYFFNKCKHKNIFLKMFCIFTFIWIMFFSLIMMLFSRTVPAADAYSVYNIARRLAIGDTSVIHPTESYLSYYPQQLGLAAFLEIIIRLLNFIHFPVAEFHAIKLIYAAITCVGVYFIYKTINLISTKESYRFNYLLLTIINFPFIMYTSFVYSEIPSITAICIGTYYLFLLYKKSTLKISYLYAFLSSVAFGAAVALRKNSLIFIIALIIVTTLVFIQKRKLIFFTFLLLTVLFSFSSLPALNSYYEHISGSYLKSGVTATSYIAMGMQEASRAPGWYNGFNFYTYQDNNMDSDITNEISKNSIKERLNYFSENPSYALDFYSKKYLSAWGDGTYASRQATLATFGERHPIFQSLYVGTLSHLFIEYSNLYQNILYLGSLIFCVKNIRNKKESAFPQLLINIGLMTCFGGFLFHMLWEANSRYIFPYSIMSMPYCVVGINYLLSDIYRRLSPHSGK